MMRKLFTVLFFLFALPMAAQSLPSTFPVNGYCDLGGKNALVSGLGSTNYLQGIVPGCTVTVYDHGTVTKSTIFADDNNTPLANPFTAVVQSSPNSGAWIFWAATSACYDVVGSGGTSPNNYASPITLTEVCLGGSGGGSITVCGVQNDVQLNGGPGTLGCDSTFLYASSLTHTLYDWVFSVAHEVDVGDTTNSGVAHFGSSDGATVHNAVDFGVDDDLADDYGLCFPDSQPPGSGYHWSISSGTPITPTWRNGGTCYPGQWVADGTGAAVSAEHVSPLMSSNSPAPATTNDIIFTRYPVNPWLVYAGPDADTQDLPYPVNFSGGSNCVDNSGTLASYTCSFASPVAASTTAIPHHLVACAESDINPITGISDSLGNSGWAFAQSAVDANKSCWMVHNTKNGNNDVTVTFAGNTGFIITLYEEIGAADPNPIDTSLQAATSQTGSGAGPYTQTWTVTTAQGDGYTLAGMNGDPAGIGYQQLASTATYNQEIQYTLYGGGGLGPSRINSLGWGQLPATGANSITVICNVLTSGAQPCASNGVLLAFKPAHPTTPALPNFLLLRYSYLLAGGDFPAINGQAGKALIVDSTGTRIDVGTFGTGSVTSVSGTANQVDVATGTTTPVISLSSTLLFPGTITMGAHAADFGSATSFKVPSYAGGVTTADGNISFDSTAGARNFHAFTGGFDHLLVSAASTPANLDCPVWVVSGANVLLGSSGSPCASGSGTVTSVTGTTNQIDVATGTTTPVISLDPQYTVNSYGTCTNTADALTVTPSDAPTSLANGLTVACKSSAANTTTTPTLNVNSLGAKTIVKAGTSGQAALVANDILTNMVATFKYNAATTTWELQNPQQPAAGGVTSVALSAPSEFTVSGSPVTGTGTLTFTKANQNAGYFYKAPPATTQTPFLVQSKTCVNASATSQVCALNAATSAGHLITVGEINRSGRSVSAITDNLSGSYTSIQTASNNSNLATYYHANSTGGEQTITITLSGAGTANVFIEEWANVATSTPLDTSSKSDFTSCSGSAATMPSVTTTNAHDLIIGIVGIDAAGTTITAGTGYTLIDSQANSLGTPFGSGDEYTNVLATATYSPTVGCANNLIGVTAAFKAATSPPASTPLFSPPFVSDFQSIALGPIYNSTGVLQTVNPHTVVGSCTLGTSCSVTLTGSSVFTSTTSYQCTATDQTSAAAVKFAPSSGSAFALTGTGTDVLGYICSGD